MDVFDRLEVAFGRLETETVVLLQGYLDVFLWFRFGRERFALGELLVVEEGAWGEFGVFGVGNRCRVLLVQPLGVVSIMRRC